MLDVGVLVPAFCSEYGHLVELRLSIAGIKGR
jgi:hypothetical protein